MHRQIRDSFKPSFESLLRLPELPMPLPKPHHAPGNTMAQLQGLNVCPGGGFGEIII